MTKIKCLSKIDLPREKLLHHSPISLHDYELLAIILGSGIKGINVVSLAKLILQKIKKVGLTKISMSDLRSIKGVGPTKALQILATIELGKRFGDEKPEILSDTDIYNLCTDIRSSQKEHLIAFFLDTQSRLVEKQIISIGTLDSNLVHPRELFEPAITLHSASVIIVHNHPSGMLDASRADIQITKRLIEAGKIIGIPLQRHLIIAKSGFKRVDIS